MQGTIQKKTLQKIMSQGSEKNSLCILSRLETPNPSEAEEFLSKTFKESKS